MITDGQYQRATRGRLPSWFLEQPPKLPGDDIYLGAYEKLSTDRRIVEGGSGPIPWSVVDRYAESHGFGGVMRPFFVDIVMRLDIKYREHLKVENDKKQRKAKRAAARKKRSGAKRG